MSHIFFKNLKLSLKTSQIHIQTLQGETIPTEMTVWKAQRMHQNNVVCRDLPCNFTIKNRIRWQNSKRCFR